MNVHHFIAKSAPLSYDFYHSEGGRENLYPTRPMILHRYAADLRVHEMGPFVGSNLPLSVHRCSIWSKVLVDSHRNKVIKVPDFMTSEILL